MKIIIHKTDGTGVMPTSMDKALAYARSNEIAYIMIDYEDGTYMRGDFTEPDMAVDFLERMQYFRSPKRTHESAQR